MTIDNGKFLTIIGDVATDIFDFYGIEEMHGLNRTDAQAEEVDMTTGNGIYIQGWSNYDPNDTDLTGQAPFLPFIFLNKRHFVNLKEYEKASAVMHETSHMAILLNDWNVEGKEEEIITQAEQYANRIMAIAKGQL